VAIRGSQTALLNHCVVDPMMDGSPTRSGRSVLFTPLNALMLVMMFNGLPVCACVTTPAASRRRAHCL
jgi:hypothetical protein